MTIHLASRTIVTLNGSPRSSSRTAAIVGAIATAIAAKVPVTVKDVHLGDAAPHLLTALSRDQATPEGEEILRTIESADLLVIGTPVYRASIAGALKHIFDLIDRDALIGRIAVLSATGGTSLHGLIGEHQLRPLLSFFRVFTAPTFVYATEDEFDAARLPGPAVQERIARAAEEAAHLLIHSPAPRAIAAE
jgi:FMN reductase